MRRWGMLSVVFGIGLLAATFASGLGSARVTDGTLTASVGPGFSISLTESGAAVTSLAPGTYTIDVSDTATVHNFHLTGPGVDQATSIAGTGSTTWTVTLATGSYHFQCDAHPSMLHGDFSAGGTGTTTAPTTTSPPPPPPPPTTSTTTTTTTTTSPPPTTTPATTTGTTTTSTAATTTTATSTATTTSDVGLTATPVTTRLSARLVKVTASRTRVAVTVAVTRSARVTVDLLTLQGRRLARSVTAMSHSARITLRPARRLAPGRYLLRIRLVAGGRSAVTTRAVRVA